jgi:hypothetical protein
MIDIYQVLSISRRSLGAILITLVLCFNASADIVIWGDSQHNYATQERMVDLIVSLKPSAVFRTGDMLDDGHDQEDWNAFRKINEPLLGKIDYFPAFGNHEGGAPAYFDVFSSLNGRHWYSVDKESVHFIVLDSNLDLRPGSEQYQWLLTDLKEVQGRASFIAVLFHHSLFSAGYHKDDERKLRPALLPLFKKYGVQAVFSGHDHHYARFECEGIQFIVTGGGGSSLYPKTQDNLYLKKFAVTHQVCVLASEKDDLSIKIIDIDGNIIEKVMIKPLVLSVPGK